jgi:hypothetical protein
MSAVKSPVALAALGASETDGLGTTSFRNVIANEHLRKRRYAPQSSGRTCANSPCSGTAHET